MWHGLVTAKVSLILVKGITNLQQSYKSSELLQWQNSKKIEFSIDYHTLVYLYSLKENSHSSLLHHTQPHPRMYILSKNEPSDQLQLHNCSNKKIPDLTRTRTFFYNCDINTMKSPINYCHDTKLFQSHRLYILLITNIDIFSITNITDIDKRVIVILLNI